MTRFNLFIPFFLIFLLSCGDVAEKQAIRNKTKDGLRDHRIVRITEDQIINEAFIQGDNIIRQLEQQSKDFEYWQTVDGQSVLDSINRSIGHLGFFVISVAESPEKLSKEETALLEAYQYSSENGQDIHENLQSIEGDYLLFTLPISREGVFVGMWSLRLSKKNLIRNF